MHRQAARVVRGALAVVVHGYMLVVMAAVLVAKAGKHSSGYVVGAVVSFVLHGCHYSRSWCSPRLTPLKEVLVVDRQMRVGRDIAG
jgi:hypothetical protein